MANTTRMMMNTVHSTKGQPKGARAVASKRKSLLMGVSALTLLLGTPAVLVTIVARHGSAPREVGSKMLVLPDKTIGSVGGGIMAASTKPMGIGVYGPALNKKGNPVAGLKMLKTLSEDYRLSVI